MGMGGAIFDWLRMLYRRMAYYARHGDMQSAEFEAVIGLLTGDPVLQFYGTSSSLIS
jgi:hypothetical protein